MFSNRLNGKCQIKKGGDFMRSVIFRYFFTAAMLISPGGVFGSQLSFPGAEGFGRFAKGGRGGRVIEVANLNDSGRGSLRAAVEAEGPRIVIFRVSGNIELKRGLKVTNPYITIAGQTAPGDGICLKDASMRIGTHDVIVRFMRFRLGGDGDKDDDSLGQGCENVIIDHCSASWSVDETMTFYRNNNVTVQWCIISESLWKSHHMKGAHGYGGIWGGNNATFHHNLFAHHSSRNPRFARNENIDHRNNVIYNWGFNSAYGGEGCSVNMIANYYKPGPATEGGRKKNRIVEIYDSAGKWYVAENFVEGNPKVSADNWAGGVQVKGKLDLARLRVDKAFPAAAVRTQTAKDAYKDVLSFAGAILPKRDAVDRRIVEEVAAGTAQYGRSYEGGGKGIIDSQEDVGGWPELKSAEPLSDSDHDGMPDEWEQAKGLNPKEASDGAKDRDGDGYLNVEEYLNSLVAAKQG